MSRRAPAAVAVALLGLSLTAPAVAAPDRPLQEPVRFATFNASLNRFAEGDLLADLETVAAGGTVAQVEAVLEIIERNDPDVLLVNEFDFDPAAAELFAELADYPHHFTAPSNTGVPSGYDLNNDGTVGGPDDAYGFGFFPGQYGMLVLSRHPLPEARTSLR